MPGLDGIEDMIRSPSLVIFFAFDADTVANTWLGQFTPLGNALPECSCAR
jgi:hypothetical protein